MALKVNIDGKALEPRIIVDQAGDPVSFDGAAFATLLSEALPAVSTVGGVAIFAHAPAGTKEIWLTIRTAGLTITTDGTTAPTAGAHGHDFASDGSTPYVFRMNQAAALLVKAIQNGGTATGWIVYRG